MDFFKSVFSAPPAEEESAEEAAENPSGDGSSGGVASWGALSGIVKTLVSKSEPLIQNYRRDLEEFGSGLRKETEILRETIREIPASIDAKSSLQTLDEIGSSVWKGTAEIIAQGKDLLALDEESSSELSSPRLDRGSNLLSRFEAKIQAIQADSNTFTEEPEDGEEFKEWNLGFDVKEREEEIARIMEESISIQGNLSKLVPEFVDYETFWGRYFYKVHKLKQAEDLRANLVKKAISGEEEDLSWEIDDEEHETNKKEEHQNSDVASKDEDQGQDQTLEKEVESKPEEAPEKVESCKDSDVSIVSTQPSIPEDDDLGWDEIEDLGENDDKKVESSVGNADKVELRKRLVSAEDDEDLSWDIDDDDSKKP